MKRKPQVYDLLGNAKNKEADERRVLSVFSIGLVTGIVGTIWILTYYGLLLFSH